MSASAPARLVPRSLQGQLLLAVAAALLLAQAISAGLIYRAQAERREASLVHAAAMRLFAALREDGQPGLTDPPRGRDLRGPDLHGPDPHGPGAPGDPLGPFAPANPAAGAGGLHQLRVVARPASPLLPGEHRLARDESELHDILTEQGADVRSVLVVHRPLASDSELLGRVRHRAAVLGPHGPPPADQLLLAAIEFEPGRWLSVTVPIGHEERALLLSLIGQTVLLFALLVGAIALIVGRITRPLRALTRRIERFALVPAGEPPLASEGPDDIRRLIEAHARMEGRIAALLDEKDVMLGAIGHDLKTPLAALRVRIESVESEVERARMAATIEDISRSLDDILSLARVGRPSDPHEPTELAALIAQVAEEYEDMAEPVAYAGGPRIVLAARATWLRRALRNLVSNALRYGQRARITLERVGDEARVRIEDDGPGIAPDQIARMVEPFTRGEPSRNSETGGAGLGLTLARAIAEQHGGRLILENRRGADGAVAGLAATLALPIG